MIHCFQCVLLWPLAPVPQSWRYGHGSLEHGWLVLEVLAVILVNNNGATSVFIPCTFSKHSALQVAFMNFGVKSELAGSFHFSMEDFHQKKGETLSGHLSNQLWLEQKWCVRTTKEQPQQGLRRLEWLLSLGAYIPAVRSLVRLLPACGLARPLGLSGNYLKWLIKLRTLRLRLQDDSSGSENSSQI